MADAAHAMCVTTTKVSPDEDTGDGIPRVAAHTAGHEQAGDKIAKVWFGQEKNSALQWTSLSLSGGCRQPSCDGLLTSASR
jgi:hypothetical protein